MQLLTSKPALYVCNVEEANASNGNKYSQMVFDRFGGEGAEVVVISAKIEAEVAQLDAEERKLYLTDLGLEEPGLNRLIAPAITFWASSPISP